MRLLSLALFAAFLVQAAQSPTQQQRPKATIEGTVTRFGGGQPIAGARVSLSRRGGPPANAPTTGTPPPSQLVPVGTAAGARGAPAAPIAPLMTDDKGRFSFQVDEGTYSVDVEANGYVRQPYGQRYFGGPGLPVTLTSGQVTKDINISLMPAATVSGRIRDTADQPLVNVPVQLLRYSYDYSGQRTYQTVGSTLTNDRGEYRMFWVTPGRYYLLAGRPTTGSDPLVEMMALAMRGSGAAGNPVPATLGYAFYPGVTDIATAQTLDLQPAADLQAVDLALTTKSRTFAIRGKLVDSKTGQPPPRANVAVRAEMPGTDRSAINILDAPISRNYNAATGTFEIRDLAPGAYTVVAVVQDLLALTGQRSGPPEQSSGMLTAAISNSDVEGLVISVAPAAAISGRLRVEGQLPQGATMERIRLMLVPTTPTVGLQLPAGTTNTSVTADGSFRLNNVAPGNYRIEITGFGGRMFAGTGFLKEARFDGLDVLNNPFHFTGSASGLLEVVLAIGGGQLTGTVTDVRSQPVPSMRVVLVPDRLRSRPDLYRTTTTDANGRFSLAAVAPGDYKVFSWESMEEFGWFDADAILRAENRGRAVHVTETSTETVEARLISAEGAR